MKLCKSFVYIIIFSATTDIKLNEVEDLKQTFVISSNENGGIDL